MFRTTAFAAGVFTLSLAAPAAATDDDTQAWLSSSARVPLAEGLAVTIDGSERLRAERAGEDQQLVRATVEVAAADWLTIGGGVAYLDSEAADEKRLLQAVTFHTGNLAIRTQIEERFFDGAARPQIRGRERVQLTVPLDESDRLLASVELNYILQHQDPAIDDRIDHWRFRLDWRHQLASGLELSAAYMAMLGPRPGAPDRLSHVPILALAYSF